MLYFKLDAIRAGRDVSTVPALGRPVAMIILGTLVMLVSTWRLLKGHTQIVLQEDHLEALGQTAQIPYKSIRDVKSINLSSWDVVVLTLEGPANDPDAQKGRKRISNMGHQLDENQVPLWVSQSGWLASDLCDQICERLPMPIEKTAP